VGKEIINQIFKFDPKIVRILDIDEPIIDPAHFSNPLNFK